MHISVIIPAYNSVETIQECLDSVFAQTRLPDEVIVIDDASTDDTVETVTRYPRHATREIAILRMEENRGPAAARNRGIKEAKGEWIAFLDADDQWLPWALEMQIECHGLFPHDVLFSGGIEVDWHNQHDKPRVKKELCRKVKLKDFIDENPVATSTVFVRKESIVDVGYFDESFRGPEDIDLWMRVATTGGLVVNNCLLAQYRVRPGSLSMSASSFLPEIMKVYAKAYAAGGALYAYRSYRKRTMAMRYASVAWTNAMCGSRWSAVCTLIRSWVAWPWLLKPEMEQPFWRLAILKKILFNVQTGNADRDAAKSIWEEDRMVAAYAGKDALQPAELMIVEKYSKAFAATRLLDIGCGTGRTTEALLTRCKDYTGIDYSRSMVAACGARFPGTRILECDMRDMRSLKGDTFGVVFCSFNSMDYISHTDRLRALEEIRRHLDDSGLLVFSSHNVNCKDALVAPRPELSINPVACLRGLKDYCVLSGNHRRNRRLEILEESYSILNDCAAGYTLMTYYIDKDRQRQQLEENGFRLLEMYRADGELLKSGEADSDAPWIYYVARKQ